MPWNEKVLFHYYNLFLMCTYFVIEFHLSWNVYNVGLKIGKAKYDTVWEYI